MRFADVLGQSRAISGLQESLRNGRVNSAYLFCGPEGVGKRSTVRSFAATLLCESRRDDACGECKSCRLFKSGGHPDYIELVPEKNEISVAEIRDFCREISIRPTQSTRRVCVLLDAEKMNASSANCFLKTLEEPPGQSIILLRAESHERLLRTIVSRCQIVRLSPLEPALVAHELARRGIASGEAAQALAVLSEGSLGRAAELSGGQVADDWAWVEKEFDSLSPGRALAVSDTFVERTLTQGKDSASTKIRTRELLDMLGLFYRKRLRDDSLRRGALWRLEKIYAASEQLERNVNTDIVLRNLTLELAR